MLSKIAQTIKNSKFFTVSKFIIPLNSSILSHGSTLINQNKFIFSLYKANFISNEVQNVQNNSHNPQILNEQFLQQLNELLTKSLFSKDQIIKLVNMFNKNNELIQFLRPINHVNSVTPPNALYQAVSLLLSQRLSSFGPSDILSIFKFVMTGSNVALIEEFVKGLEKCPQFLDMPIQDVKIILSNLEQYLDNNDIKSFLIKFIELIESKESTLLLNSLIEYSVISNKILSPTAKDIYYKDQRVLDIVLRNLNRFNKELRIIEPNNLVELFFLLHDQNEKLPKIAELLQNIEKRLQKCYNIVHTNLIVKLVYCLFITGRRESPILERLDEEIVIKIHYILIPDLVQIINFYSKMGLGSLEFYEETDKKISSFIDTLDPRELPDSLFSFTSSGRSVLNFATKVQKPLLANLHIYSANELAKILWSLMGFQGINKSELYDKGIEKLGNCSDTLDVEHITYAWDFLINFELYDNITFEKTKNILIRYFEQDDLSKITLSVSQVANLYYASFLIDSLKEMGDVTKAYIFKKIRIIPENGEDVEFLMEIGGLLINEEQYFEKNIDLAQEILNNLKYALETPIPDLDYEMRSHVKLIKRQLDDIMKNHKLN